jgi:ABC-type polysaccharide/polyol phosphate transport system ATPase subunit
VDGVSVRYRVPQERIPRFKEYAIRRLKRTIRYDDFWALRDVSLSVAPGEVVGIIGPNGAGKTTLLKVIARVLRPTTGRVRVRGWLAPLLEVGAAFNFELTGRENIYLNGAILGFTQKDLAARFDRIVEFAGLQDFIEAPLRTYSTGMVARLGFSIATDVQPDILLVDEILQVGDAEFQRRSAQRIGDIRANGASILLVSHSLVAIESLCDRALWLEHGHIRAAGSTTNLIKEYQAAMSRL